MINNLEDAMVVIREQAQKIERLRASAHNSDYAKCPVCKGDTYTSVNCLRCDYSESLH